MHHTILIVDYIKDDLHAWLQTQLTGIFQWDIFQVFTQHYFFSSSHTFRHGEHDTIQILPLNNIPQMQCNVLDISYIKHTGLSIFDLLHSLFDTIHTSTNHNDELHLIMLWFPLEYFPHHIHTSEISYITSNLPSSWDLKQFNYLEPVILVTQSITNGLV